MNRILSVKNIAEARRELAKINVSSRGVQAMEGKSLGLCIKLSDVHLGAANILKQEMLSIGADAAVARGVVNGIEKISDVILLGNANNIQKLIHKLEHQMIFGLPQIKSDLEQFLKITLNKNETKFAIGRREMDFSQTRFMGILNVTPDSFSDGNKYGSTEQAVEHAFEMIEAGADIIDIGGESTRPGAQKTDLQQELARVIPVILQIRQRSDIPISIDTSKAEVAEKAIASGADIINDISALRFDHKMVQLLKKHEQLPVILMHMQGTPATMQQNPCYQDVVQEILSFFEERLEFCRQHEIDQSRLIIDPGIGFGKRQEDNLEILNKLIEFRCLNVPVLLGASRKSFIDRIYKSEPHQRLEGSLAAAALAFEAGIEILRVHDVKEHKQFWEVWHSIRR